MTKTIFLLDIDNFAPELKKITLPFIQLYAERIGANIHFITERKFPQWPVTYEKLQIYELAKEFKSDFNLYIDLDTLIHPECPDFTIYLPKGTIAFHASDVSHIRFRTDDYFLRDGRYIAPGNWFMIASDLCLDLWRPLDLSLEEILNNINPTPKEIKNGITREHLIDDYVLASNISRFGLRFKSFEEIYKERGFNECLQHEYTLSIPEKIEYMKNVIKKWNIAHYLGDVCR
jgi:hypothetical protein